MSTANNDAAHFKAEVVISNILRWGVVTSLSLMVAGTILCFAGAGDYGDGGGTHADFLRLISSDGGAVFSWPEFWRGVTTLRGEAVILAGLLLLILTPVARVAVSVVLFAVAHDWRYVAVTSLVLALLVTAFFLGKIG